MKTKFILLVFSLLLMSCHITKQHYINKGYTIKHIKGKITKICGTTIWINDSLKICNYRIKPVLNNDVNFDYIRRTVTQYDYISK